MAVESVPGKISGAWVFRGTRVPLSADQIQTVLDFAAKSAQNGARTLTGLMKITVDESTPQKLRQMVVGSHEVVTTWFQRWSGMKNGGLLSVAEEAGFDL